MGVTKTIKSVFLFLPIICLSIEACHGHPTSGAKNVNCRAAAEFDVSQARQLALSAVQKGDFHLLAVQGYTIEVPGVNMDASEVESRFGYQVIPGTSDFSDSDDCRTFNDRARKYAETYNKIVWEKTKK